MKKIDWMVSIMAGLVMAIAGIATGFTNKFLQLKPVFAETPVDAALSVILTSHTRWQTITGEAKFIWYSENGSTQTYINKFSFSQPDHVYVEVIDETGLGVDGIWISDGINIYDLNKKNKTYSQSTFRAALRDLSNLPNSLSEVNSSSVTLYPLSTVINAPIREYIFPIWFPQGRKGDLYNLVGEDIFLGRKVWIISLDTIYNDQMTIWADQSTGIILKVSQFMDKKLFLEMEFTSLEVDRAIDNKIFDIPQNYQPVSK